jgi:hypothetical protein
MMEGRIALVSYAGPAGLKGGAGISGGGHYAPSAPSLDAFVCPIMTDLFLRAVPHARAVPH